MESFNPALMNMHIQKRRNTEFFINRGNNAPSKEEYLPFLASWGYDYLAEAARSCNAVVVRAGHRILSRHCALKISYSDDNDGNIADLVQEARLQAALSHTSLVPVHDCRIADGMAGIAMEWIDGPTMRHLFMDNPRIPLERIALIIYRLANVIDFVHGSGVVHCDLKPGNILIANDTPLLTDFGSAIQLDSFRRTPSQKASGTLLTMAPELFFEDGSPCVLTDVYSLGVILYFCLAGRYPHDGRMPSVLLRAKLSTQPLHPEFFRHESCEGLGDIAVRAMAADPSTRYATVGHMATELGTWLGSHDTLSVHS